MKTCILVAENFEEIEMINTVDVLRRGKILVDILSISEDKKVMGCNNISVFCDDLIKNKLNDMYDCVIFPGGPGYQNLAASEKVKTFVIKHHDNKKKIAAVCAAHFAVQEFGLFKGATITCYPLVKDNVSKDYTYKEAATMVHGNYITGRSPSNTIDFALKIVEELTSLEVVKDVVKQLAPLN
ncbi:Parkinson disease protein 7 [Intoshia linei]|uniref:Parkinson disease protein 7 n=1 Tax=Intoshia linei TaxID=1819745 RepID=A0A177B3T1_9BILA|nr:Parkinson disease protein 7 [Intoshia linei]